MALTPAERKAKLGLGGLTRIALKRYPTLAPDEAKKRLGHVSQVNALLRYDEEVRDLISAEIIALNPDIDPTTIWPTPDEDPTPRAATSRATA